MGTPLIVLAALLGQGVSWTTAFVLLIAGETSALFLSLAASASMTATFSEFWHDVQPDLRSALKHARKEVAAAGGAAPS